ncbi:hypothetical protein BGX27_010642, partial [Mortierella sp. AM989]
MYLPLSSCKAGSFIGGQIKTRNVHGALECPNPNCPSFKNGYTIKARDAHEALSIAIAGTSQLLDPKRVTLPPFSREFTQQTKTPRSKTINTSTTPETSNKLPTYGSMQGEPLTEVMDYCEDISCNMTTKLTLYCLVDGQSIPNTFDIEIESTKTVANLRKDIHSAKPVMFSHVDANDLTLWRVSLTDDDDVESAIALHALDEKEKLLPRTQLSELFPSPPGNNTYIIVQPSTQVTEPISDCAHTLNSSNLVQAHYSLTGTQQQILDLLLEAQDKDDKMLTLQMEAKDKDDKMLKLQQEAISLQNQALDRLVILQKHAQAILVQNFELHEYPIPRLFIILPVDRTNWNPMNVLEN